MKARIHELFWSIIVAFQSVRFFVARLIMLSFSVPNLKAPVRLIFVFSGAHLDLELQKRALGIESGTYVPIRNSVRRHRLASRSASLPSRSP